MKKFAFICASLLIIALALNTNTLRGLMRWLNTPAVTRAEIAGKDGPLVVSAAGTVVNKYGILAVNAAAGSAQLAVNNPGGPNGMDLAALQAGDLLLVIQMAGATIDSSNTVSYGNVTNLNSAGRHEFVTVNRTQGNTITINPPCGGLRYNYAANGKTQVIRVPQYTTLTVNSGASLTAPAWNGQFGGIVVTHVQNTATINGVVDVSGAGFRGGALSAAGGAGLRTDYVSTQQDHGAEKGEGIAGYQADYDLISGRYGRGAAANAGGGGAAHNSGGGGGANGNNGKVWTGQGVMDGATVGAAAWALDPGYVANGNSLTDAAGGGRGGYSYSVSEQNALAVGPNNVVWAGDQRREVGGLGGRPVPQDPAGARIFFGGGGGAGAQNNDSGGAGGAGGGLIYIIADNVNGTGTLRANGANGANTRNDHRDAPGGGGAGGTIVVFSKNLSGPNAQANGGNGGNQTQQPTVLNEAEGPGGGGGGGFIAFTGGALGSTQINPGVNGLTSATALTEFPANGATRGATGATSNVITSIPFCSTTSDLSITKTDNLINATPGVPVTYTIVARNNGPNDVFGVPVTDNVPPVFLNVSWTCTASTGSRCSQASGAGSINTLVDLLANGTATFALTGTPNPSAIGTITNNANLAMPAGAVDTNPTNDAASDTDQLQPQADLSITKTDGVVALTAGLNVSYTIVVRNNGPSTADGAAVNDIVPTKLSNVAWTCVAAGGGSCGAASGNGNINTTVNLPPNATATFTLNGTVRPDATGSLINTATVTAPAGVPDPQTNNNSATDTDTINATVDLSITKTNNTTALVPGTQTVYNIVVSNAGPSAAIGAIIADALPSTLTNASWTCAAGSGSACGAASGSGNINTTVDLAAGSTATFTLTATVSSTASGSLTNTASVTPATGTLDTNTGNNTASDTDTLNTTADLFITKTNGVTTITAGTQTVYTIVVTNSGPSAAVNATVNDAISDKLTGATWTCAASSGSSCAAAAGSGNINTTISLLPNGTATFTLTATLRADAVGVLTNGATIVPPGGLNDTNIGNNTATDVDQITNSSDLAITKTNNTNAVTPGTPTTYTIVVANNGPSAVLAANVTDNPPATLSNVSWTCAASSGSSCGAPNGTGNISQPVNLIVGGAVTYTLTGAIANTATGTLANTATVAPPGSTTDANPANNTATDTDPLVPAADLAVTKTSASGLATPGQPLTYTILVTNNGPSAITGATVTDTLPATLTNATWACTASSGSSCGTPANGTGNINTTVNLAVSGTATFTLTATIASTASGTLTNSASVAPPASANDPTPTNNTGTSTVTLQPSSDLSITKTSTAGAVTAGGTISYTITARNDGPSAVTNATVVDTLPNTLTNATWACTASSGSSCGASNGTGNINTPVSLLVGGTATFTLTATLAPTATGTLENTATINPPTGTIEPSSGNNTATVTNPVIGLANLRISKTVPPAQGVPGNNIVYTVVVTNDGPSSVTGATVTDNVPSPLTNVTWTCAASSGSSCGATTNGTGNINTTVNLASGGTVTYTITALVPANATGSITNVATVAPPGTINDPDGGNNSSTVTTTLQPRADLAITKTAAPNPARAGDEVNFTLNVTNQGPSVADNVVVTDPLPAGVEFVSATSTRGTCSGTSTVTCNIGTLGAAAPDNTATVTIRIRVPFTFPVGPLGNTATVASTTTDPGGGNNSGTTTVTITPPPGARVVANDLVVNTSTTDVCLGGPNDGGVVVFEVRLRNSGDGVQRNNPGPELLVTFPTQLTGILGSCATTGSTGACTLGATQLEWNGEIAAGATVTITFRARVRAQQTPGTRFCPIYRANYDTDSSGDNDASVTVNNLCLVANCFEEPECTGTNCPVGPGLPFPANSDSVASDQKPGSVLIFPYYTSSASSANAQNTRINITNVNPGRSAFIHLFFVDGATCSVADAFLCLTPNQTSTFLASDLDPGTTGYIIAVAINPEVSGESIGGCPTNFNYLIGDEYVKLTTGHAANLGAEAVAAIAAVPSVCDADSVTAQLRFDGVRYDRLGRVVAADNVPSRADGNNTLLILNRIGGDLAIGASTLGSVFGILYDDQENALSFGFTAGCQFRDTLSNNFPRSTPRFESFVPAGRTGWLKLSAGSDSALVGATINFNENPNGFKGGHNLHKLTLTDAAVVTIPIFPPSCQ